MKKKKKHRKHAQFDDVNVAKRNSIRVGGTVVPAWPMYSMWGGMGGYTTSATETGNAQEGAADSSGDSGGDGGASQ
jgi:hypothetical protein